MKKLLVGLMVCVMALLSAGCGDKKSGAGGQTGVQKQRSVDEEREARDKAREEGRNPSTGQPQK